MNLPPIATSTLADQPSRERLAAVRLAESLAKLTESISLDGSAWNYLDPRDLGIGDSPGFALNGQFGQQFLDRRRRGEYLPVFLNEHQLSIYRRRIRWLAVNNEIALNAVNQHVNYAVGEGLKYECGPRRPDVPPEVVARAQAVIDAFGEVNHLPLVEAEAVARVLIDGEAFLRLFPRRGGLYSIRFVEPEHVKSPDGSSDSRDGFGVRTGTADVQDVEGYWVIDGPDAAQRPALVPASEIIHVKHWETPSTSKRGLSAFYPVETTLRAAEDLVASTVHLAKTRAKIAWIQKLAGTTGDLAQALANSQAAYTKTHPLSGETINVESYGYGTILRTNSEIEFPAANIAASDHVAVMQMVLRMLAARFSMPEYLLSADASNGSYSSTLVAESPFVKAMQRLQHYVGRFFGRNRFPGPMQSLVWRQLCRAAECGLLPRDVIETIDVQVQGPSLTVRDTAKEAQVDKTYHDMGVKSVKTIRMEQGLDSDEEDANLAAEAEANAKKAAMQAQQGVMPGGANPGEPNPGEPKPPGGPTSPSPTAVRESDDSGGNDGVDAGAIADIFYGIYGDKALGVLRGLAKKPLAESWDANLHPRGKGGKFIKKGSAEAVSSATAAVDAALAGEKTDPEQLLGHLSLLTVAQIRAVASKHGKTAPKWLRADLIRAVMDIVGEGAGEEKKPEPKEEPKPELPPQEGPTSPAAGQTPPTAGQASTVTPDPFAVEATPGHWAGKYKVGKEFFTSKKAANEYAAKAKAAESPRPEPQPEKPTIGEAPHLFRQADYVAYVAPSGVTRVDKDGNEIESTEQVAKGIHRNKVRKAIKNGESVPPEVLADYPEFSPKPTVKRKPKAEPAKAAEAPTPAAPSATSPDEAFAHLAKEGTVDLADFRKLAADALPGESFDKAILALDDARLIGLSRDFSGDNPDVAGKAYVKDGDHTFTSASTSPELEAALKAGTLGELLKKAGVDSGGKAEPGPAAPAASPDAAAGRVQSEMDAEPEYARRKAQAEAQAAPHWEAAAKALGVAPEKLKADVDAAARKIVAESSVYVRVPDAGVLAKILGDGRFKGQHEAGRSGGAYMPAQRARTEASVLGVPEGTPAAERPVYAYLGRPGFAGAGTPDEQHLDKYGGVSVKLRDGVRDRSTVTFDDSWAVDANARSHAMPMAAAGAGAVDAKKFLAAAKAAGKGVGAEQLIRDAVRSNAKDGYVEAQVRGGVSADDIAEVRLPGEPDATLAAALKARGIAWTVAAAKPRVKKGG